jgi:hypothetical protein
MPEKPGYEAADHSMDILAAHLYLAGDLDRWVSLRGQIEYREPFAVGRASHSHHLPFHPADPVICVAFQ